MKVIVFHRALGTPKDDWYPWLEKKLGEENIKVEIPELGSNIPEYESWVNKASEALADADKETFIVGHSLGNMAAFRALEDFPEGKSIGGMIVVANVYEMPPEVPDNLKPIAKFYEKPVDWEKLKNVIQKSVVFHDKKDDHAPFAGGEMLSKKLGAKLIATEGKDHYMLKEFPELLDELHEMMK